MNGNIAEHDQQGATTMPEFVLDYGTREGAATFAALDAFTQGYIEAMFFTEATPDNPDLEYATVAELAPETLEEIKRDCEQFQTGNASLLDRAYEQAYDDTKAGRDYWFTRNGHGVGFWDRGLGDVGEKLSSACQYDGVDLYRGDDGKLYL